MCKTKEALKTETLPLTCPCGYICSCFNLFTATTYRPRPLSSVLKALGVKWFYCLISYDLLSNFGPEARTLHISDLEIFISLAYVCHFSPYCVFCCLFSTLSSVCRIHQSACSRKTHRWVHSLWPLCRQLHDPTVWCHNDTTAKLFLTSRDGGIVLVF